MLEARAPVARSLYLTEPAPSPSRDAGVTGSSKPRNIFLLSSAKLAQYPLLPR